MELYEKILAKIVDFACIKGTKLPDGMFRLVQSGKEILTLAQLDCEKTLFVELRGPLRGGKGGFGSLLRSVKPKAKDDDNFEACRDLSGRRLRHINNERRIKEF